MSIVVTPIPRLIDLTAPAFTLGTANAAGSAVTAVASDSTLLAFDTTVPDAITFGQSGAAGSATVTARRDHAHAMVANPANLALIGTAAASGSSDLTIDGLDSTYDSYIIELSDLVPTADGDTPIFRVGDSGGIKSGGTDYGWIRDIFADSSTTPTIGVSTGASGITWASAGVGSAAGEGLTGWFQIHRPGDGSTVPLLTGQSSYIYTDGALRGDLMFAQLNSVITLTQVQFKFGADTVASGRLTCWGMAHG